MDLTTILQISESVGINDQRFIGQTISRNQRISTSEIVGVVPFAFELKPMNFLRYSESRQLLSALRVPDRQYEQYLNFKSTGWVNYITYRGDMTPLEIAASNFSNTSTAKNLIMVDIPSSVVAEDYVVRTGDFCQYGRFTYIATADVLRGNESSVTIPVHRNIIQNSIGNVSCVIGEHGETINFGEQTFDGVTFPVILREYPTYTLIPITNDSYIQWNGAFNAFENVVGT